ncbi:MAG: hypothetical protein IKJ27_08935 [Clostridia bacterium]|nr:hypothetical protein [Clostridia bacterium]
MAAEKAYDYYAYGAAPQRAPERVPENEKKPELRRVGKTQLEIRISSEKKANRRLVKIAAVVLSFLILYAVVCDSFVARDTARHTLDKTKEEYVFSEARNRELKVQLNSLVSAENIDRIATEELGLVKAAADSEVYLDTAGGNKVIFSEK